MSIPISERAGSALDHRFCRQVFYKGQPRGHIDRSHRLYQHGGPLSKMVRWSMKAIAMDLEVWLVVQREVSWIEIVDSEKNQCYRTTIEAAALYGQSYSDAKTGQRYAIPLDCFDVISASGAVLTKAVRTA